MWGCSSVIAERTDIGHTILFKVGGKGIRAFWTNFKFCSFKSHEKMFGQQQVCLVSRVKGKNVNFGPVCSWWPAHRWHMDHVKRIWYLSPVRAVSQEEPSDRKPDPWPIWIAGHALLKFVMTECSKTQIRLTGLIYWCSNLSHVMKNPVFGGLRSGKTQTGLLSNRDKLESWNIRI